MRFFLRSRNFKIFAASLSVLIVIVIVISVFSRVSSPVSSFFGTIATPVQKVFSSVSDWFDGIFKSMDDNEELMAEIDRLKLENAELSEKLTGYEEIEAQNKQYEQYLGI
ncbi:MAG: hypothetical protein J6Q76_09345 [Clostridia bacterium]|nr:hypothetical protein [Clostridia bacterium]